MKNFDDFWAFLLDRSADADAWWLTSWLESALQEYLSILPCPQCGSRIRRPKKIWSATGNHVLETHVICGNCMHTLKMENHRPSLLIRLNRGEVKIKDADILRAEVEP